jgi:hypothetical protein
MKEIPMRGLNGDLTKELLMGRFSETLMREIRIGNSDI